jgi:hypothetical protein
MLVTLDFSRLAMTMLMHVIGMFSIMQMMFFFTKIKHCFFNNAFDEMPSTNPCHAHT